MRGRARIIALALAAAGSLPGTGCGGAGPPTDWGRGAPKSVVVGSTDFPENELLAEIYAQALERRRIAVTREFDLGGRELTYPRIASGALSILPEYNGALLAYLTTSTTPTKASDVDRALAGTLPASLRLLDPAPAEDRSSLVVTADTAVRYELSSIVDLAKVPNLVVGGPPGFESRQQGLIGLRRDYGVDPKGFTALDEAGPMTVSALRKGDVQAAELSSTDPSIVTDGFVVLTDPAGLFPAQNVTPLVNTAALNPVIRATLNEVSANLDTPMLAALVTKVVTDKRDPSEVAADWLTTAGVVF